MTSCIVPYKASDLCHEGKLERAKANIIFRWLKSHAIKHQMGTRETQRSHLNLAADVLHFMQHIHRKVTEQNCDSKFIINMDQTPVFFTSHSKGMLEWKGPTSVNICNSRNDTKSPLWLYLCVQMVQSCLQYSSSKEFKTIGYDKEFANLRVK